MKYQVVKEIEAKTVSGIRIIKEGQMINMPPEKAEKYVNEGKLAPIIEQASDPAESSIDARAKMCKEVIGMIGKQYIVGTLDFVRVRQPETYQEIVAAEKRVNEISRLLDNPDSPVNIADFKAALSELYRLNIAGIQLYKGHLRGDSARNRQE